MGIPLGVQVALLIADRPASLAERGLAFGSTEQTPQSVGGHAKMDLIPHTGDVEEERTLPTGPGDPGDVLDDLLPFLGMIQHVPTDHQVTGVRGNR